MLNTIFTYVVILGTCLQCLLLPVIFLYVFGNAGVLSMIKNNIVSIVADISTLKKRVSELQEEVDSKQEKIKGVMQ